MSIDNGLLHREIENGIRLFVFSLYMSLFLSLHILVKDISATIRKIKFIFGIHNNSDKLYCGIENRLSFICSYLYFVPLFLFIHSVL